MKLVHVKHVITAIARLHNFCINERLESKRFNEEKLIGTGIN